MAGPTWTNPDQVVFLNKRLMEFVAAQSAKTLTEFWTTTWRDFFLQWPTPDSELVPNGLATDWDGSLKITKKKKKKTSEAAAAAVVVPPIETNTSKWVSLRREVCASVTIITLFAYDLFLRLEQ